MTATSNIPLNVPFKEKDEAKALGARWNPGGKHWYVPEGVEEAPFAKWLAGAPEQMTQPASTPTPKAPSTNTAPLPNNANVDDINAMLRDASETDNDVFFEE